MLKVIAGVVAGLAALGALVALVVVTQGFGFFLQDRQVKQNQHIASSNNNFTNHLYQGSYATLTADQSAVQTNMSVLGTPGESAVAQKGAATATCGILAKMQAAHFSLVPYVAWNKQNCAFGILSKNSAYNK